MYAPVICFVFACSMFRVTCDSNNNFKVKGFSQKKSFLKFCFAISMLKRSRILTILVPTPYNNPIIKIQDRLSIEIVKKGFFCVATPFLYIISKHFDLKCHIWQLYLFEENANTENICEWNFNINIMQQYATLCNIMQHYATCQQKRSAWPRLGYSQGPSLNSLFQAGY